MHKKIISLMFLFFFNHTFSVELETDARRPPKTCVRGCLGWGFFAEFLWVINHLHWCESNNLIPVVYWDSRFAYYSEQGFNNKKNCWEYYFEPVSDAAYKPNDAIKRNLFYTNFSVIWPYFQYIENIDKCSDEEKKKFQQILHLPLYKDTPYPVGTEHLYNPSFRQSIKKSYLDKYIKIKPTIMAKINRFYNKKFTKKRTIGVHLRGKFIWNEVAFIPTPLILQEANKYADGNTQFFIATDQYPLLEEAKQILNGDVIYYEHDLSPQTTSPIAGGDKLHPKWGEDILIEMMLLSKCDHLIHTLSNVSTTALYFNPSLNHTVLY